MDWCVRMWGRGGGGTYLYKFCLRMFFFTNCLLYVNIKVCCRSTWAYAVVAITLEFHTVQLIAFNYLPQMIVWTKYLMLLLNLKEPSNLCKHDKRNIY